MIYLRILDLDVWQSIHFAQFFIKPLFEISKSGQFESLCQYHFFSFFKFESKCQQKHAACRN